MTNTKWLRRALLGGVALSVMASGAQADELSDLKAQLEALQSRVDQIEQQPAMPALPEGASFITMSRGSADIADYGFHSASRDDIPADRGFTIAITPAADLPAPISEVVVYGFVKGDVIYDFDKDLGDSFYVPGLWTSSGNGDSHIRLHAKQTRFGIRSRTDTAIGQIRTQIEGDFFTDGNRFRLRHGIGHWDMTPNWTLSVGQTWFTAALLPIGVSVVDFSGFAGPNGYGRRAQVRLTYHSGPISWAVAIEQPSFVSDAKWPNLSAYLQFDAPGGHQFIVTGTVADHRDSPFSDNLGWAVQAGANINLADIATLTVGALYGEQEHCAYLNQVGAFCGDFIDIDKGSVDDFFSDKGWGLMAGLSFGLTDTTTFNVMYGISWLDNEVEFIEGHDSVMVQTVHANILWRPVQQMQLGWEVMWGQYDIDSSDDFFVGRKDDDAIRAQFGAWFFF
ncbi:MAG TPA: porin [Aestuariivirgaceae bacterium]|nr:porin [Aestuariivirgaceae bacterium]